MCGIIEGCSVGENGRGEGKGGDMDVVGRMEQM